VAETGGRGLLSTTACWGLAFFFFLALLIKDNNIGELIFVFTFTITFIHIYIDFHPISSTLYPRNSISRWHPRSRNATDDRISLECYSLTLSY
jgi:hypothetical protein